MGARPIIRTLLFLVLVFAVRFVTREFGPGLLNARTHSSALLVVYKIAPSLASFTSIEYLLHGSVSRNRPLRLQMESWMSMSIFLLMAGDVESNLGLENRSIHAEFVQPQLSKMILLFAATNAKGGFTTVAVAFHLTCTNF